MTRSHPAVGLLAVASFTTIAAAQSIPLEQRTGGLLLSDASLDQIWLCRDLDGDGVAQSAGECTVFFDETNASGFTDATSNVFSIFASTDRSVFIGDGGSDTIYRLTDTNGDRDAQDAGEAIVYFSDADSGFDLASPNGVWQGTDGALYVVTAGTSSTVDAVYRTIDLNADGDANDPGEATVWFDLQAFVANSSAFSLVFVDDVAYIADLVGGDPDAIYRAEDLNGNGRIDLGEFNIFIDDSNAFGVGVGFALATDGVALYTIESSGSADQRVSRLEDLNESGTIDQASEVTELWNDTLVAAGLEMGTCFAMAFGPGGDLALGSNGGVEADNVFLLRDANADGDYADAGETITFRDGGGASGVLVDNPRALAFVRPREGDVNGDEVVDFNDLVALLAAWGPCAGCPEDLDGSGTVDFADLLLLLAAWD